MNKQVMTSNNNGWTVNWWQSILLDCSSVVHAIGAEASAIILVCAATTGIALGAIAISLVDSQKGK
jgi:ABC-type spermidine/putrescine transport system permease subunit II